MAFFMISYDLRKKDEFDYQRLWDAFKKEDCVKCQESVYLMQDKYNAKQIKEYFLKLIHEDDLLTVVEFTEKPEHYRGLKGTMAWIDAHWT
jgi:CRISPR/Cas system-associated endoribonuclease Cas2